MRNAYFLRLNNLKDLNCGNVRKSCDALHYRLDNIFIIFDSKLYRQILGIPTGSNCAPLVAELFLFCYERSRDLMLSLSDNNQTDVVDAFNCTSRYLDDLVNINAKFGVFVDEGHSKFPTLYWVPKFHKIPYLSSFIANSNSYTTPELSITLTSCFTAIKNHVTKYCETVIIERNGKIILVY